MTTHCRKNGKVVGAIWLEKLDILLYFPDLASSSVHLFPKQKEFLGSKETTYDEVK
jgi:hypothetical protein